MQQCVDCEQGTISPAYPVIGSQKNEPSRYYFYTDFIVSEPLLEVCQNVAGALKEVERVERSDQSSYGGIMLVFKDDTSPELYKRIVTTFMHNLREYFDAHERQAFKHNAASASSTKLNPAIAAAMAVNSDVSAYHGATG